VLLTIDFASSSEIFSVSVQLHVEKINVIFSFLNDFSDGKYAFEIHERTAEKIVAFLKE